MTRSTTEYGRSKAGPLSGTRTLVVGGNGFIGRHVVRQFQATNSEIAIMDMARGPDEFDQLDQVVGSISDATLFASAVAGCDNVIFLANSSLPGSSNVDLASEVDAHVQVTVKAAEICHSLGVKRFIFASSGGTVYGYSSEAPLREDMVTTPRNAYGVSKLAIENYLRIIGMRGEMSTVSLRISNPYGEGQRALRNQGFIAAALQHAMAGKILPIWGDGSVERDFIHVSDVARAFLAACTVKTPPEVVNIGSGQATSLRQILKMLEAELGRNVAVEYEPGRSIDVARNVLDNAKATRDLNWVPQIPLVDGLARTVGWWRKKAHNKKGIQPNENR